MVVGEEVVRGEVVVQKKKCYSKPITGRRQKRKITLSTWQHHDRCAISSATNEDEPPNSNFQFRVKQLKWQRKPQSKRENEGKEEN